MSELRSTSEAILARLDDNDPTVRGNILLTITALSQWYPQDFGDGSNLMVASLSSETHSDCCESLPPQWKKMSDRRRETSISVTWSRK